MMAKSIVIQQVGSHSSFDNCIWDQVSCTSENFFQQVVVMLMSQRNQNVQSWCEQFGTWSFPTMYVKFWLWFVVYFGLLNRFLFKCACANLGLMYILARQNLCCGWCATLHLEVPASCILISLGDECRLKQLVCRQWSKGVDISVVCCQLEGVGETIFGSDVMLRPSGVGFEGVEVVMTTQIRSQLKAGDSPGCPMWRSGVGSILGLVEGCNIIQYADLVSYEGSEG